MNIYFCGIGGAGLGPLAELAQDAGHTVQGSDTEESLVTKQLAKRDVAISTNQNGSFLQANHERSPIDWFVYSSGIPDDHPEIFMARKLGIKMSKRDELIAHILKEKNLQLIAIAGTHGKTRTVGLTIWVMQQLGIPVSYSVGTTMPFGPSGKYVPNSTYFVYECDEFDRNFLKFHPYLAVITTIDYDHPDTYGSPDDYIAAFRQFLGQSEHSVIWQNDANLLGEIPNAWVLGEHDKVQDLLKVPGEHNRHNASLIVKAFERLGIGGEIVEAINTFPGVDRRFEQLAPNLYTDYGHHPTEIAATLQQARELNDDVVLVYQPHQNLRQHEVRRQYVDCFMDAKEIYWLPTYLTREDKNLPVLTPEELTEDIENRDAVHYAEMNDKLWETIQRARDRGALVLAMGAGSIDDWMRGKMAIRHASAILVIDMNGNFILQHRDKNPSITYPDMLTPFGGGVEPTDASMLQAAARELSEETNLSFTAEDLSFFKMVSVVEEDTPSIIAVYVLTGADTSNLEIYEGQGFVSVGPNELNKYPLTIGTRAIITEYTHPALVEKDQ